MRAVKTHTWKKLMEQGEIAEKSDKKFESSVPKSKWGVNPRDVMQPNLPNPRKKKSWPLSYQGELNQNRRAALMAIRSSNSHQRCTPSKTSRW